MKAVFLNVSAPGHVYPTLGLVAELIRRGESVVYFEHPPFQKEIESFGATFRSMPMPSPYPGPPSSNQFHIPAVMTWCTKEILPSLLESVAAEKPDYIIHDSLCLWGRLIAHLLDIPAVCSIASAAFNFRSFYGAPPFWRVAPGFWFDARSSLAQFRKWEKDLRQTYSLPRTTFLDTFTNSAGLNICYLPREAQPYGESFDSHTHFVGPCDPIRQQDHDFPLHRLDASKLIYISFGTHHDPGVTFYRACIEAFQEENVQVLLLHSPQTDPATLGPIPDHFLIYKTGGIPQLEVLQKARLFLSHAGGNAIRESLWYSVPTLAVPQTYEQDLLARRLQSQGAGLRLPQQQATAIKIRNLARHILTHPSFAAQSRRIGESARRAGGAFHAADLIERYVTKQTVKKGVSSKETPSFLAYN